MLCSDGLRMCACSKIWDRELIEEEIEALMSAFSGFAKVSCTHNVSIISLICNVARTSSILERVSSFYMTSSNSYPAIFLSIHHHRERQICCSCSECCCAERPVCRYSACWENRM